MNKLIKQAFTLIELLVVIAIIGILSGLIVVSMGGMTTKATIAKAQIFSNSVRNSLMIDLVAEYKFNENLKDSWKLNDCTWHGADGGTNTAINFRPESECVYGKCLDFDGTDDYVDCGSSSSLNPDYSFTVAAWFNISGFGVNNNDSIVDKYRAGGTNDQKGYKIFAINGSPSYFQGLVGDGTANHVGVGNQVLSPINLNEWYYGVLTHSYAATNGSIGLYLNGELKDSNSVNGYTKFPASNGLKLGAYIYWPSPSNYIFKGRMDDIRIYNAAIPTSQIKEQYYAGLNSLFSKGKIEKEDYISRINSISLK